MQKRFFDRYLKGIDNGWENEPPVEVEIRAPGDTVKRAARSTAWPLPETQWTRFFLDAASKTLGTGQPHNMASATYPALSGGSNFLNSKDFERPGATGPLRGVAWFTHDDPTDRPPELFAGTNTRFTPAGSTNPIFCCPCCPCDRQSCLQVRVPTRLIALRSVLDLPLPHHP